MAGLRLATLLWAFPLALGAQDDSQLPPQPQEPGFNPFSGGGVVAPRDPKEETAECMKDLDCADRVLRDGAIARLSEMSKASKDVANLVRTKLTGEKNDWIKKYRNVRREALSSIKGTWGVDISGKREQALGLLKAGDTQKMRPIVEEMWKATYPDTKVIDANAKVQKVVDRVKECNDNLRKFGDTDKEDLDAKLRGIALDQDEELIYAAMPAGAAGIMQVNNGMKAALSDEEYRLIVVINMYRVLMGRNALKLNTALCQASKGHSKDMKEKGFFAHDSPVPGKRTLQDRARQVGASCSAENIYMGGTTGEGAFWAWFGSPGHHQSMMADHRQIAIGSCGTYWTADFASR